MSEDNADAEAAGVPMTSIFATTNVEDEAEAALVAVLEDRRDLLRSASRPDSQRDVLPAVPPHVADLLTREDKPSPMAGHRRTQSEVSAGSNPEARRQLLLATRDHMSSRNIGVGSSVPSVPSPMGDLGDSQKVTGRMRFTTLVSRVRQIAKESESTWTKTGAIGQGGDNTTTQASEVSPFIGADVVPNTHAKGTDTDALFKNAQRLENLYQIPESSEEEEEEEQEGKDTVKDGVEIALSSSSQSMVLSDEEAGPPGECSPLVTPSKTSRKKKWIGARIFACRDGGSTRRRKHGSMAAVLGPRVVLGHLVHFLCTTFLLVMVPMLVGAGVLYYYCGNFQLSFLPFDASLSWWLIFIVRQLVTLQLAYATEYVVVDAFACRSSSAVKILGPLLTLFAMQAKGWPYILATWGIWDLILLHGDLPFVRHWLYLFDIAIFSDENPDAGFLDSDRYLRILLAAITAGLAVSVKKTYLALYMGRRTFQNYKPRLEQIMVNIVLLAEIADLAAETETPEFIEALAETEGRGQSILRSGSHGGKATDLNLKWADIKFEPDKGKVPDDKSSEAESVGTHEDDEVNELVPQKLKDGEKMKWNEILVSARSHGSDDGPGLAQGSPPRSTPPQGVTRGLSTESNHSPAFERRASLLFKRQSTSTIKIKNLLDRWEEPENKLDKARAPSIHDILQFRKALAYMDGTAPFSESFGPSATRDQCIKSSQKVYKRLLNFVPGEFVLPFDVIGSIAMGEDGSYDKEISLALVRLFRPDKDDELTTLTFVQSCDWVYKKVRYFRASVANSTLIDRVLEHDFNIIFYFLLLVVIMTILDFDAWTLLVSFSTLALSVSFAVGPSAARAIEGILLIAVRRPYDLGDRISLTPSEFIGQPDSSICWFVEDVNLFSTTLRFAPTNEVSTVNNGSIANSRIINFARSQKALVNLTLLFKLESTSDQIELFRAALNRYIKDNPRCWIGVVMFRISRIDPDMQVVEYKLRVQHVKAWQEMASVLVNQGELLKFCIDLATKLGIVYDEPARSMSVQITSPKDHTKVGIGAALQRFQSADESSDKGTLRSDDLLNELGVDNMGAK